MNVVAYHKKFRILICLFIVFIIYPLFLSYSYVEQQRRYVVPLKLRLNKRTFLSSGIDFGQGHGKKIKDKIAEPGKTIIGKAPGNIYVSAKRIKNIKDTYIVKVDTDADENLNEEMEYIFNDGTSFIINVYRKWQNEHNISLPYKIKYYCYDDPGLRKKIECFSWSAYYLVEGYLQVDSSQVMVVVKDQNGDGVFNNYDRGSNFGIDYDGDTKIRGDELKNIFEIFEFEGNNYMVDHVDPYGSELVLEELDFGIPEIGAQVPNLSLTTTDGSVYHLQDLKSKVLLINFWHSAYLPSVERLSDLKKIYKQYGDDLLIISSNTDKLSGIEKAQKIVTEYQLTWPMVINGKGKNDLLWSLFGSMAWPLFKVPLFVLVNRSGEIIYAGKGGNELSELKEKLKPLF